jgi:hypothetical protein
MTTNELLADAFREVYPVTLTLFWIFALGVLFLRPRWALLSLLLGANVNVIQPGFLSAASVGWQNGLETLVLPTVLLLRLTGFKMPRFRWGVPALAWAALTLYAAVSILWSPFKVSGVKMVGFLAAWFILYLVFHLAWQRMILDEGLLIAALWCSLALACIQTYLLGCPEEVVTHQFTSFTAADSFAIFLCSILAFLLFSRGRSWRRNVSLAACVLGVILAEDRTALIGLGFLLLVWLLRRRQAIGTSFGVGFATAVPALVVLLLLFFGLRAVMAWRMPESRLNELLQLGSSSAASLQDIGTLAFRLDMYESTLSELSGRTPPALVFGSGTASGGGLSFAGQEQYLLGMDPNRTIHNEFLRVLYEWGLIGLSLGLALIFHLVRQCWCLAVLEGSLPAMAAVGMLPAMLLLLIDGNPLSSPAATMGMGLVLVLTYGFSAASPHVAQMSARTTGVKPSQKRSGAE